MRLPLLVVMSIVALRLGAAEPARSAVPGERHGEGVRPGDEGGGWPLWDGQESVEQYARRASLEPSKTLDLGDGVKLELALIPAGRFMMGTPEPESPWVGLAILVAGGLVALVLVAVPVGHALRQRRRPQFSLRWLILLVVVVGVGQYGFFRAWEAGEARKGLHSVEFPAHDVAISAAFYMGRFEVTQEQYEKVLGANPSKRKGPKLPVEEVSWDDAREFCGKAGVKTGFAIGLPTEAEWEYACRAGTTTMCYAGDSEADVDRIAWHSGNSGKMTHPVGQKAPNGWGLHDMHGNVWEWCADWWGRYERHGAQSVVDPQGPAESASWGYRVTRGGSWDRPAADCRSADRSRGGTPGNTDDSTGFRVVVEAPKKPK